MSRDVSGDVKNSPKKQQMAKKQQNDDLIKLEGTPLGYKIIIPHQ